MARSKLTDELERDLYVKWEALAFRHGGFEAQPPESDQYVRRLAADQGEWDDLLAQAFDGEWKVGPCLAGAISHSRWHSAMTLGRYVRAEQEILRLMLLEEGFDRSERLDAPIKLAVARIAQGRYHAAADLEQLIYAGVYSPASSARAVSRMLDLWLLTVRGDTALPPDLRELARCFASVKKVSKRVGQSLEAASTTGELMEALADWR